MNYSSLLAIALFAVLFSVPSASQAQSIEPEEGFSPQIGYVISMLDDLKRRVTRSVQHLNQEGTDFLLDDNANRIGAMIVHLAATEKIYQIICFEGRDGFNEAEEAE